MLTVSNVSKRLGDHLVLDHISFNLNRGERVGLVGPNGAGKSTLLAILAKRLAPDAGSVWYAPSTTIGFLRQGFADLQGGALGEMVDEQLDGLLSASKRLEVATNKLGDPSIDQNSGAGRVRVSVGALRRARRLFHGR